MHNTSWTRGHLGDYAYIKARIGWRGLSASEYTQDGPYLIAGTHIQNGLVNWASCDHVSTYRYQESLEIALRTGDIILTKDGTIGRIAIVTNLPGLATINGTMMLIRVKPPLQPRYLYHYLTGETFQRLVADKVSGSSIPHIFQRDMVHLPILIPSEREQKYISSILDIIDTQVQYTEQLIAKLNLQKTGLLQDILTRGLDKYGQLRDPIAHPEEFKDSVLGMIPKDWEVVQVGQLAERITSGSRGWAIYYSNRGSLFLRISNLTRESVHLRLHDLMYVSPPSNSEGARTAVKPGDVLISITAELGLIGVIPPNFETAYVNQHIALVRFNNSVYPEYIANYLAGKTGQKQFRRLNDSGAKAGLNLGAIANLLLPLPSIQEQIAISSAIKSLESIIRVEVEHQFKLKMYKKGLMQDLLSGNIHMNPKGDALSGEGDFCKDIK